MPAGAGTIPHISRRRRMALLLPDFVLRLHRAQAAGVESYRVRTGDGVSNGQGNPIRGCHVDQSIHQAEAWLAESHLLEKDDWQWTG